MYLPGKRLKTPIRCSCLEWRVKGNPWKCTAWYSLSLPTFRRCHLTGWYWATTKPGRVSATYPLIAEEKNETLVLTSEKSIVAKRHEQKTSREQSATCKFIAGVVPGILSVGLTGWRAVSLQVLLQVPALSFIERVEEQGELLDVWLLVPPRLQFTSLTDHQRSDQTWVKVFLLYYCKETCIFSMSFEYRQGFNTENVLWEKNINALYLC